MIMTSDVSERELFVACLSKSQPTAAPNPESVSGNEVQMKEEKMSKALTITRQIAPKVETTLIDENISKITNIW